MLEWAARVAMEVLVVVVVGVAVVCNATGPGAWWHRGPLRSCRVVVVMDVVVVVDGSECHWSKKISGAVASSRVHMRRPKRARHQKVLRLLKGPKAAQADCNLSQSQTWLRVKLV